MLEIVPKNAQSCTVMRKKKKNNFRIRLFTFETFFL